MPQVHPKGAKKQYAKEAIEALAANKPVSEITFGEVSSWIQKNRRTSVSEPLFYSLRKEMSKEELRLKPKNGQSPAVTEPPKSTMTVLLAGEDGIVTLVRTLKSVVQKLGKNQTKELIDEFL